MGTGLIYAPDVSKMTAQEIVALGVSRFGGNVALANEIKLREVTPADNLGQQVRRWRNGEHEAPGEVVVRVLDALGAIKWEKLEVPPESDAATTDRIAAKSAQARQRIAKRPNSQPRRGTGESRP